MLDTTKVNQEGLEVEDHPYDPFREDLGLLPSSVKQRAKARFERKNQTRDASNAMVTTMVSHALQRSIVGEFVEVIREWRDTGHKRVHIGRHPRVLSLIEEIPSETLAFIASRVVCNHLHHKPVSMVGLAREIGRGIRIEAMALKMQRQEPELWKRVQGAFVRHCRGIASLERALYRSMATGEVDLQWERHDGIRVGTTMLLLLHEFLGVIELIDERQGKRTIKMVRPTARAVEFAQVVEQQGIEACIEYPILVDPYVWQTLDDGPYQFLGIETEAIRYSGPRLEGVPIMSVRAQEILVHALNIAGTVPWRVNMGVLEVARHLFQHDLDLKDIPSAEPIPLPPYPDGISLDSPEGREMLQKRTEVREQNASRVGRRVLAGRVLAKAREYQNETHMYFPMHYDFRGRMYPMPNDLTPTGSKLAKGLLEFSRGKRLGESGLQWLAIWTANCFDQDKLSLDERVQWFNENVNWILSIGSDPLGHISDWAAADKPWQGLAACMTWVEVFSCPDPADYVCHLPVWVDGSCNGLQHLAALLRDQEAGVAVNLVPSDKPADIYALVAKRILDSFRTLPPDHPDFPVVTEWLQFGVSRKLTKRPVMVVPYSGTREAAKKYVHSYIYDYRNHPDCPWPPRYMQKATAVMVRHMWPIIGETVKSAMAARDWLTKVAREWSNAKRHMWWRTPDGFVAGQPYWDYRSETIRTTFFGRVVKFNAQTPIRSIDRDRQRNGVTPNVIHSLDANAMRDWMRAMHANGMHDLGVNHDSFGCHAADMEQASQLIRDTFVDMYQLNDPLRDIAASTQQSLPEAEIPEIPPRGTLDLEQTRDSPYFFA